MANLPTSGQQYWGASLNNYIRSLESKITNIENNLSKKGLATAYLGSGWTDGDYKFSSSGSDDLDKRSPGVYDLSLDDRYFTIKGNENQSLIFFGQDQITTKTVEETIDFSKLNCIITTVKDGDVTYAFEGTVGIGDIKDGFFPIYIYLDVSGNINFGISCLKGTTIEPGSFVYHEDFVLLGLIEKINGNYSFIKQTYTARKSLLDTRRDLLVPFATITNQDGLFEREGVTGSSTLTLYLESLTLDYQVGGIISSDNRSNAILDYKHFDSTGRRVFKKDSGWMVSDPADGTVSTDGKIRGIYISISGDIFIDSLQGVTAEYADWSLNTTNEFKNAGLVLLGAYSGTEFWYAQDNGLSPAFITTRELPTDSIIDFPEVQLASSINRLPSSPEIYKLNIINDRIFKTNTVRNLNLDLDYVDNTPDMVLDYSILALPTFEDQSGAYKYWETLKGRDNNFLGARLMSLTLNTSGAATVDGSLTVNGAATLSQSLTVDDKVTASSLKVEGAEVSQSLTVGSLKTTANILRVKGSATVDESLTASKLVVGTTRTPGFATYDNEIGIYSPTFSIIMGESGSDEFGTDTEDRFTLRYGGYNGTTPIHVDTISTTIGCAYKNSTAKIQLTNNSVNVTGNSTVNGNLEVTGNSTVNGNLKVTGAVTDNLSVDGDLNVAGVLGASGGNLSLAPVVSDPTFATLENFEDNEQVAINNGYLIVDDILLRVGDGTYMSLRKKFNIRP